jgi:hypothetical protein
MFQKAKIVTAQTLLSLSVVLFVTVAAPLSAYAVQACGGGLDGTGKANPTYTPSIDVGCKGIGNPITDFTFGIIRILSDGVGLVIIGSIIVGGIQFSASRGDPQATAKAITRIRATVIALFIYIFGYAILNYIIPAGFLK